MERDDPKPASEVERRRAQEAQEESDRRFRWLVEISEDLICTHDPVGRILSVNPSMIRLTGYSEDELIGRRLSDFLSKGTRSEFSRYMETILREGHAEGFMRIVTKEGSERVLQYENVVQIDSHGRRLIFGVAHDVQRKWAENALRLSVSRLEALLNNMPDAAWMKDDQGRFTAVNEAFARVLGHPHKEIIGKTLREILPGPVAEKSELEDRTVLESGRSLQVFDEVVRPNESPILFETIKTPIQGSAGRPSGVVGIARDITERRRLEGQLLQSQKMEAIGRLAGGIAHDFNNILTSILGYCDLVLWQLDAGSAIRADVEEIEKAGNRAAGLTRQLLAFGRKQVIESRVIALNDLVLDAGKMFERLIGEDIEYETNVAPEPGYVRVDPGQMEQVLINLVVNAKDAMPRGGHLRIETRNVEVAPQAGEANPGKPGRYVLLAVTDTGTGIDPGSLQHIFEPFYTTKERGKGTGLGLATVYGIVQQNAGDIRVHSEVGRGSRFEVYLPRVDEAAPAIESPAAAVVPAPGSGTVLLVEDEEAIRSLTERVLKASGYTVLAASDAADAEKIVSTYAGPIHIVVTDVIMPHVSGPQLARRLLAVRPNLRVLYTSGYMDSDIADQVELPADAVPLMKPFTPARLVEKVREVLDEDENGSRD